MSSALAMDRVLMMPIWGVMSGIRVRFRFSIITGDSSPFSCTKSRL